MSLITLRERLFRATRNCRYKKDWDGGIARNNFISTYTETIPNVAKSV